MSTQPRLRPTRRTVLRTAAWTAPAVSIVVAAPAFAASGKTGKASGTLTRDRGKGLTFNLAFTNTGVTTYSLRVVVTYKNGSTVTSGAPTTLELISNDDAQTVTLRYYADTEAPSNLLGTLTFIGVDRGTTTTGSWA